MSKVGIILVNYNGERFQNDCIRTILEMDYKDIEIVLVDNKSTDGSVKKTMEQYGEYITLLQQPDNYGIAKGNNIGIQYCIDNNIEYTLLLNNDVELDTKTLGLLMKCADESTIIVPKIYFYEPSNMIWFAGGNMNWKQCATTHYGMFEYEFNKHDKKVSITYAPTCCMLLPTSVFKKIGFMDEEVFMYYDDTDLCVRLINEGYNIIYEPKAIMWHKVSSSAGIKSRLQIYYLIRNKLYFMNKYKHRMSLMTRVWVHVLNIGRFILSPVRSKSDSVILKAYKHYYTNQMGRCDNI